MATVKKKAPVKKAAPKKKAPEKKAAPKEKKAVAAPKASAKVEVDMSGLDRKGLAARARQLKLELLAIRFNIQSPNLNDYRKKRSELATVLRQLN